VLRSDGSGLEATRIEIKEVALFELNGGNYLKSF